MNTSNFTREELAQYILTTAKDVVIEKFIAILAKETVLHSIDGAPLTKADVQKELLAAEQEIAKGDYITSKELDQEIASWQ
ncbi:MAG: hypothetical protein JKY08_08760 [Flavobacteriaceae bacterium]|nr:hypothetical protein [Flavobacteriaceae bacterium]